MKVLLGILLVVNIAFANTLTDRENLLEQKVYQKAFKIDKKNETVMYNLEIMHNIEPGVNSDQNESTKWFNHSSKLADTTIKESFDDNIGNMTTNLITAYDILTGGKSGCSDTSNSVDNIIKDTKVIAPCTNAQTVSTNPSAVTTEEESSYLIYGYGLVALVLIYVMF